MAQTDNRTGEGRPPLTLGIKLADFRSYYWLKQELEIFCRSHGLATTGGKIEITARIEAFLKPTGQELADLSLNTIIHAGFVCTQRHRAFFCEVIGPKFHFSTFIQNFLKANVGKTYRDVVSAWEAEETRKKAAGHTTTIPPQFEYNQFTRDFFADPKNKGQTPHQAIQAWKIKRGQPGD